MFVTQNMAATLSLRGDRSFLTYFGEMNREYLGTIVIHQIHFLSVGNDYERVRTSPNNVRDAGAIAIHRIGSGQGA